jgi:hypothetical protein
MSDVKELCDECGDYRCTCLSLLTPAHAAVIAAAKVMVDGEIEDRWFSSYVQLSVLRDTIVALRAQEGA